MNTLGSRIKYAREKIRMSQQELADAVGITQPSLVWIESGKTKSPRNIEKLASCLNVSREWLLIGGELQDHASIPLEERVIRLEAQVEMLLRLLGPKLK